MRKLILTLSLSLLAAPTLGATEVPAADEPRPAAVATEAARPAPAPEEAMRLREVQVEPRPASADEAAAQLPARGSFWWLVGVIVVAGVILAVVL